MEAAWDVAHICEAMSDVTSQSHVTVDGQERPNSHRTSNLHTARFDVTAPIRLADQSRLEVDRPGLVIAPVAPFGRSRFG
jgi:hypothetical protein